MTNTQSLLRTNQYRINDAISIYVPSCGEIYDYGESEYYRIVQLLTSVPYDLMVQLDDIGVDFETISEYQLFLMMLESFVVQKTDLSIVFNHFDLLPSNIMTNSKIKNFMWVDSSGKSLIDQKQQIQICDTIRKIHFWKKTDKHVGNAETKKYLIERNRLKQKKAAKKKIPSFLDENIIKMVNTEEFKYNYEQCMDLSIYKFNASLQQIPKKKNWEQTMNGAYFGTVDLSKINIEKIHWMSSVC